MNLTQKVNKPKTKSGKRFLENRGPKLIENVKTAAFIRGSTSSNIVLTVMKNLCSLKKPYSVFFNKKNEYRPFEDITPVEMFSQKNDFSLFVFGSHNKKRPHNLIVGRMYDYRLLDMFEFGVENFKPLEDFKVPKIASATKPMLLFAGEIFEQPEYQRLKNFFIDFFRGPEVTNIRLQGLEHVIMFTAEEEKIYFRSYKIFMKKSGSRTPYIELVEMGPRMDLVIRRNKMASEDLFKFARKQPKQLVPKKKKNIGKNAMGTKLGRIHMKRQDFRKLSIRKMKGLRKQGKPVKNNTAKRKLSDNTNKSAKKVKTK